MRSIIFVTVFLALAGPVLGGPVLAFSRDLSGVYDCEGFNADGQSYRGQVEIRQKGEIYLVRWRIGRNDAYDGVGIVTDNLLSVSYYGGIEGVVVYDIGEGTRLSGRWAVRNGDGRVFVENLIRRGGPLPVPSR